MDKFIRNHWYVAAWAGEVGDKPFARRLLDEPVVMFRDGEGKAVALFDQCPHRLAPLSMGDCVNGQLQCIYHGLTFDGTGQCTKVPGQDNVPAGARVHSYPAIERFGMIFLWMGKPEDADPDLMPEVKRHGVEGWDLLEDGYQRHETHYLNIVENLMDPAHTTFLHKQTIGNPAAANKPIEVERTNEYVRAYRWLENSRPSPDDRNSKGITAEEVDRCQAFLYYPPDMSMVDICVMPTGLDKSDEAMDSGARTLAYKFITPETDKSSHFFWLHLRNYCLNDPEFDKAQRAALEQTYWEDNDVCRELQWAQEATGQRQYVHLAIDKAPRVATQMINRRIEAEAIEGGSRPETWRLGPKK